MTTWTPGVDRADGYVPTPANWNAAFGVTGNLAHLLARGWLLQGANQVEASTTSLSAVDLLSVTGLNIPASAPVLVLFQIRKDGLAANEAWYGLKVNGTAIWDPQSSGILALTSGALAQAESGPVLVLVSPRSGSYRAGVVSLWSTRITATGAVGLAASAGPQYAMQAIFPTAPWTSVTVTARNVSNNNNASAKDLLIYAGGMTL